MKNSSDSISRWLSYTRLCTSLQLISTPTMMRCWDAVILSMGRDVVSCPPESTCTMARRLRLWARPLATRTSTICVSARLLAKRSTSHRPSLANSSRSPPDRRPNPPSHRRKGSRGSEPWLRMKTMCVTLREPKGQLHWILAL